MSDLIREQLSAMADGEMEPEGTRFLLKRLDSDRAFRGVWERYHLIRDCVRKQGAMAPADFCDRVSAAIAADQEDVDVTHVSTAPRRHRWRGFAGAAIAAGVAAVALFSVRAPLIDVPETQIAGANLAEVAPMTTSDLVPPWQLAPVAEKEQFLLVRQPMPSELDTYFIRHGEAAGGIGPLGPLPSVISVVNSPVAAAQGE